MSEDPKLEQWLDDRDWMRVGRGHTFRFESGPERIVDVINGVKSASAQFADLQLLVCDLRPIGRGKYEPVFDSAPISDLGRGPSWQHFLWSPSCGPKQDPRLKSDPGRSWTSLFSINGLVNVFHPNDAGDGNSSIGMVAKVEHMQTRDRVALDIYVPLFRQLRSALK